MENGLNMGIQLYYLKSRHPERFNEKTQIVPWAQYWAWRLSGIACTEVSSLGAHTDLWSLQSNKYSKMAQESGVAQYFAPMRRAGEAIGVLSEYWRQRTGLDCSPKIYAGIHDSNAALFLTRIAMAEKTQEFTIVSTGTWFVSMRATLAQISTEELADCSGVLFNVDIDSNKVPTALFMGGREIEILLNDSGSRIDLPENQEKQLAAVNSVVEIGAFILPTATPGIGPFGENNLHKINAPKCENQYGALVAIYAALVTAHGLKTIKSSSTIIIEGRFAKSVVYCRALASLLPNCSVYCCNEEANIALGALKLMVDELNLSRKMTYVKPLDLDLIQYQNRFYSHLKDTTLQKDKQS
jgi:sugar (pentulose or hexulose) kinase